MKSKSLFLSLAFATFLTSAIPSESHSLEIGTEAPSITLSSSSCIPMPTGNKKTIVNFWSASDPSSRIANIRLSRLADSETLSDVRYISICIDSDTSLASQIYAADKISAKVISLLKTDVSPEVLKDYQTFSGCRTFTIDSYGILRAISTTPSL